MLSHVAQICISISIGLLGTICIRIWTHQMIDHNWQALISTSMSAFLSLHYCIKIKGGKMGIFQVRAIVGTCDLKTVWKTTSPLGQGNYANFYVFVCNWKPSYRIIVKKEMAVWILTELSGISGYITTLYFHV